MLWVQIDKVLLPASITKVADDVIAGMDFYPNPTTNTLNINSVNNSLNYAISTSSGVIMKTGVITAGNNLVNVQDLKEGTYMITLSSNNRTSTIKFVKN